MVLFGRVVCKRSNFAAESLIIAVEGPIRQQEVTLRLTSFFRNTNINVIPRKYALFDYKRFYTTVLRLSDKSVFCRQGTLLLLAHLRLFI